jgi:hypothetical protein
VPEVNQGKRKRNGDRAGASFFRVRGLVLRDTREEGAPIDSARQYQPYSSRRGDFLCECGNSLCPEHVPLTADEYEELPVRGPGLALASGHEPSLEGRCTECGGRRS